MMTAGITFHRSFELLEAALSRIPSIPTVKKSLGIQLGLTGSEWKINLNIQTWYATSASCIT
jgi:hypothetical protein